jgi:hypothetical protein
MSPLNVIFLKALKLVGKIGLFCYFSLIFAYIYPAPPSITFLNLLQADVDQLSFLNQEVIVRGFIYSLNANEWILSSEPNLKTCCIGSPQKMKNQLFFKSVLKNISSNQVVSIQGMLTIKRVWDEKSQSFISRYHLENVKLLEENEKNYSWMTGLLAVLIGTTVFYRFLVRKKDEFKEVDST